jgi:hypothetical protein
MPTTPTLTVADNANATGATATVSGADSGTTNTVYTADVRALQLGIAPPVWTAQGSLTGNGTLALPVPPGFYWAYCASVLAGTALTAPLYFAATRSTQAILTRIRNGVQAKIQGLVLSGSDSNNKLFTLPAAQVYVLQYPMEVLIKYPCVVVTCEGEQEGVNPSTNATTDTEYPVRVFVADRLDVLDETRMSVYEKWRQQMMEAFRSQRLAGVPEVYYTSVSPKLIYDPTLPQYQHLVSGFTLRMKTRAPHAG